MYVVNIHKSVENFFTSQNDVAVNGIENPFSKYVAHVWENLSFADYLTLINKNPNEKVLANELYKEYRNKLKVKNETIFWATLLECEFEKIFYFILAYPQQVVLVNSGEKQVEKSFLGYEFSNRRGSEGIHPIQRGKPIDQCTKMFDAEVYNNPLKASTYVYKAFKGDYKSPIAEEMKEHVSRANLVDLFTFDRVDFEKTINLSAKKKVKIESKWEIVKLQSVIEVEYGVRIVKRDQEGTLYPVFGGGNETFRTNTYNRKNQFVVSRFGMSPECVRFVKNEFLEFLTFLVQIVKRHYLYFVLNIGC